jgi:hypothetical protein
MQLGYGSQIISQIKVEFQPSIECCGLVDKGGITSRETTIRFPWRVLHFQILHFWRDCSSSLVACITFPTSSHLEILRFESRRESFIPDFLTIYQKWIVSYREWLSGFGSLRYFLLTKSKFVSIGKLVRGFCPLMYFLLTILGWLSLSGNWEVVSVRFCIFYWPKVGFCPLGNC